VLTVRRSLHRRYGRSAHKGPPYPYEAYESKASGQECFVMNVTDGHVFLRLVPQGSNGHMPVASFLRQYRRVSKNVRKDGRLM
jgi:hypothetical protein